MFRQFGINFGSWVSVNVGEGYVNIGDGWVAGGSQGNYYGFLLDVMVINGGDGTKAGCSTQGGQSLLEKGLELGLNLGPLVDERLFGPKVGGSVVIREVFEDGANDGPGDVVCDEKGKRPIKHFQYDLDSSSFEVGRIVRRRGSTSCSKWDEIGPVGLGRSTLSEHSGPVRGVISDYLMGLQSKGLGVDFGD